MGQSNQKNQNIQSNDRFNLQDYIQKDKIQHEIYGDMILLQEKISQKKFILKENVYNNQEELMVQKDYLQMVKSKPNKNLIQLVQYNLTTEEQFCASIFKLYSCWQFLERNLYSEIQLKKIQNGQFEQNLLFQLIKDVINAMYYLQSINKSYKSLTSQNILIDNQDNFKLIDSLIFQLAPNQQQIIDLNKINNKIDASQQSQNQQKNKKNNIYLSPELLQNYAVQDYFPDINYYKSDVFIFGVIILECINLNSQEKLYDLDKYSIKFDLIEKQLNNIKEKYEEQNYFYKFLSSCLKKDPKERPDWKILYQQIQKYRIFENKNDKIKARQNDNFNYEQQINEALQKNQKLSQPQKKQSNNNSNLTKSNKHSQP